MADVIRTCANCGNMQGTGDFCEKCGTRMPAPPPPPAPAAYQAPQAHPAAPAAPQYAPQQQYAPPPAMAPQYGYAPPAEQYRAPRTGVFDFLGTMKRSTLKLLFWIVLGLIGLYVLFNIIVVAMTGGKIAVMMFFASLWFAGFLFVAAWVLFEGLGIGMRMRD